MFRFHVLTGHGTQDFQIEFYCDDEKGAAVTAEELRCPGGSVEVWLDTKMVRRFPPAMSASTAELPSR